MISTAALYLYSQGRLHGSGQYGATDYKNAEQLKQGGFQPYSMKIGDSYFSFQNIDPIATPLKIFANALDMLNMNATREAQGENVTKSDWAAMAYIKVAGLSIAQAVKDAGFTQGINDILKLADDFSDPDRNADSIMKFVGKKLQALIPNTISKVEGLFDNSTRDPSGLLDYLEVKFVPSLVTKKYDATGHEIKNANPWTGLYGFPDITSQSQIDGKYANKTHQEAMEFLARAGNLTNKNFTPSYDISKYAGSKSDFNLKNLEGVDLRQIKTHNGIPYWDRLNQILASSGLDKKLVELSHSKQPLGTPTNPAFGLKQIQNTLEQARHDALNKLLEEERGYNTLTQQNDQARTDKLNKKITDKTGQREVPSPFIR